jgi:hypothetical protein
MPELAIEDRQAINDLSYAYAFYCDTARYAKCAELFAEDAVFDETCLGIPRADGLAAIRATFAATDPRAVVYFIHYVTSIWIYEGGAGIAKAICYLRGEGAFSNGARPLVLGYYDDVYAKIDGRWLIKSRTLAPFAPPSGWTFPTAAGSTIGHSPVG